MAKDIEVTEQPGEYSAKDYSDPPPVPLFDPEELTKWSLYRAVIAEFVATLLFLYITVLTIIGYKRQTDLGIPGNTECDGVGILGIAWAFGGMIFVLVYCTAGISGGHINPAVTFGLFVGRKVSLVRALLYIIAQCLGAICGAGLAKGFQKSFYNRYGGGANTISDGYSKGTALGAEIIGTFVLVYTVFSATDPKRNARDSHVPVSINLALFCLKILHCEVRINSREKLLSFGSKRGKGSASPCASGETSGEAAKLNNQNGLAADLKDDQKGVKQKQNSYAEDNLENTNVETKVRGKDAPGSSKIDEASERLTSKSTNGPDVFVYPDPEFSDFDKDKKEECFAAGQIWAIYDDIDGMPRFYATIRKVFSSGFKLEITWFEPDPDDDDEVKWSTEQLPIACGKYKLGSTETTEDHLMFSHLVLCQKIGRSIFKVYPRKGETWALFKNWDIKWYMDVESHRQYDMEIVEILSDYIEGVGVVVSYLAKLKGFVSLFCPTMKGANHTFQIPSVDLFRFSHRIPSFKMTGQERAGVPVGSYELDPVSLPTNLEEIDVPKDFEVKVGHTPSVGRSTRSSNMMKGDASTDKVKLDKSDSAEVTKDHVFRTNDGSPSVGRSTRSSNMMKGDTSTDKVKLDRRDSAEVRKDPVFRINDGSPSVGMNSRSSNMSKGDTSTGKVKLDRSDSAEVTEDPVFRINAGSGPLASVPVPGTIEIPDPVFFNFDKERSLGRFRIGQIWAFYSDEDGLPKYYGLIKKLRTGPDLELQVTFLTNCWLPEKAIRWEDNKMLISCGRFKIKAGARPCLYSDLNSVSHLVLASTDGPNKEYEIFPKRGEIWALYRKWTAKIKPSDLQTWEYDIVQILDVNDIRIAVVHLELVKGFPSVFKVQKNGGSAVTMKIPRAELLRFSHQIPAIKLTEKHGSVKGCCELDPGALPMHYFSQK